MESFSSDNDYNRAGGYKPDNDAPLMNYYNDTGNDMEQRPMNNDMDFRPAYMNNNISQFRPNNRGYIYNIWF